MIWQFLFTLVGGWLFGPVGAIAGSLLGAWLFPQKNDMGPLEKTRVQSSSYGEPIHQVWGTMRVGGTVFWPLDLTLDEFVIPGTKGGWWIFEYQKTPPRKARRATWAVEFCEGPADAVEQILFNGEIVYDISSTASATTRANSMKLLTANSNGIRIHLGTADQEQDAFMLTKQDASVLPAYRNRVYAVFINWNLEPHGNNLPLVNARVVTHGKVEPDRWNHVANTDWGRVGHQAVVVEDQLWIVGGGVYSLAAGNYVKSNRGTIVTTDDTVWSSGQLNPGVNIQHDAITFPGAREDFGLVFFPQWAPGGANRIYLFGGRDSDTGDSYYSDPDDGDMMIRTIKSSPAEWDLIPVKGDPGYLTQSRIPFPRDSFGYCYWPLVPGYQNVYSQSIFIYGGYCVGDAGSLPEGCPKGWRTNANVLRDLWMCNGLTWMNLTAIGDGSSDDGGMGYRTYPCMVFFNNTIYAGGGFWWDESMTAIYARDIFKLVFSGSGVALPRFRRVCEDILKGSVWESEADNYFISRLEVWRSWLTAVISSNERNLCHMFRSRDGIHWEFWGDGPWTLASWGQATYGGATHGYYKVYYDQTQYIEQNDTLTLLCGGPVSALVLTAVYDDVNNITTIWLVADNIPIAGPGVVYVDRISRVNLPEYGLNFVVERGAVYGNPFILSNLNEILILMGGQSFLPLDHKAEWFTLIPQWIADNKTDLRTVAKDICVKAGLSEDELDFENLTETLQGIVLDRSTGRDRLELLRSYGFFDIVEYDSKLNSILRGGASSATIAEVDLGAFELQEDGLPSKVLDRLVIRRKEEKSLPERVEVRFVDPARNYEFGIQMCSRPLRNSQKITTVELPIAMTAGKGQQIAQTLLYSALQDELEITLTAEFLHLVPSDVVTINVGTETYRARVIESTWQRPGLLELRLEVDDAQIWSDVQQIGDSGVVVPVDNHGLDPLKVDGIFLDIPILTLAHNDFGFYFAVMPGDTGEVALWRGCDIYVKNDEAVELLLVDSIYTYVESQIEYAHYGTVSSPVGDVPYSTDWDRKNTITVVMALGTLESRTEQDVLNGANLIALGSEAAGWELIQFKDVVDNGGGSYTLSNLLRGCYGTEWKIDAHVSDETLVVLDPTRIIRIPVTQNLTGKAYEFILASKGSVAVVNDPMNSKTFTIETIGAKPYSPAHLTAERLSDGTWHIEWMRRTRGISGWTGQTTIVPLNEKGEVYEVEFLVVATGVVKHVQTVTVLSAEHDTKPFFELKILGFTYYTWDGRPKYQPGQNDIYGGPADAIRVRVYQMSEAVGRGYPIEGTFTV